MAIYPFFPRAMGMYMLNREFTKKELNFVNQQKTIQNVGNLTSENRYILDKPELIKIRRFIEESINDYFYNVYHPSTPVAPYLTQSWISYTGNRQFHHRHSHKNSLISGVFYVSAKKGIDHIIFIKNEYSLFFFEPKKINDYNAEYYPIMVEEGLLVLFPSNTEHMVPTAERDDQRISIAFNVFVKGPVGNEDNMCYVNL